jgi:hypothetical protein
LRLSVGCGLWQRLRGARATGFAKLSRLNRAIPAGGSGVQTRLEYRAATLGAEEMENGLPWSSCLLNKLLSAPSTST